jgi:hypothetical protein
MSAWGLFNSGAGTAVLYFFSDLLLRSLKGALPTVHYSYFEHLEINITERLEVNITVAS